MDSLRVFLILLFLIPLSTSGQKLLSGKVVDESYQPIPFAKIFVKNDADQRTVTDANGYYEMRLMPALSAFHSIHLHLLLFADLHRS